MASLPEGAPGDGKDLSLLFVPDPEPPQEIKAIAKIKFIICESFDLTRATAHPLLKERVFVS